MRKTTANAGIPASFEIRQPYRKLLPQRRAGLERGSGPVAELDGERVTPAHYQINPKLSTAIP
jgi:hypothetical protein